MIIFITFLPVTGYISKTAFSKKYAGIYLGSKIRPGELDNAPPAEIILSEIKQIIQGRV